MKKKFFIFLITLVTLLIIKNPAYSQGTLYCTYGLLGPTPGSPCINIISCNAGANPPYDCTNYTYDPTNPNAICPGLHTCLLPGESPPVPSPTSTSTPAVCTGTFFCVNGAVGGRCLSVGCTQTGCQPEFDCGDYWTPDCVHSGYCISEIQPTIPAPTTVPGEPCNEVNENCCCNNFPPYYCWCIAPLIPSNSSPAAPSECICQAPPTPTPTPTPEIGQIFCDPNDPESGIYSALGCIPTNVADLTPWVIARGITIGGGIAFLLMIYAGFQILTASGNPQKVQAGKELLTAAVSGLLVIIFSIFLLELIGVDILHIPGIG